MHAQGKGYTNYTDCGQITPYSVCDIETTLLWDPCWLYLTCFQFPYSIVSFLEVCIFKSSSPNVLTAICLCLLLTGTSGDPASQDALLHLSKLFYYEGCARVKINICLNVFTVGT